MHLQWCRNKSWISCVLTMTKPLLLLNVWVVKHWCWIVNSWIAEVLWLWFHSLIDWWKHLWKLSVAKWNHRRNALNLVKVILWWLLYRCLILHLVCEFWGWVSWHWNHCLHSWISWYNWFFNSKYVYFLFVFELFIPITATHEFLEIWEITKSFHVLADTLI